MVRRAALALLLLVTAGVSGCMTTSRRSEVRLGSTPLTGGRLFREVSPVHAVELLMMNVPAFVRMIEIDVAGQPVSDTLNVWVQHCAPRCVVPAEARASADLIISCYPNGAPLWVRLQHVLPAAVGAIWIYDMGTYLYVSPGREPLYDAYFAMRARRPAVRL